MRGKHNGFISGISGSKTCFGKKQKKVAALPYDVVSREEAREIGETNPESFLHIDRAEMDLDPETDLYDPMVYQKARENLDRFQKEGILIQDEKPNYYLYELIRKGKIPDRDRRCQLH